MKHSLTVIIATVLLLAACKPTIPSQYIQPDEMEQLLYDYHVAQAMARSAGGSNADYLRVTYFHTVLKKHNLTEAEFDSSLVYYYSRVDYLEPIYAHVNERLQKDARALGAQTSSIQQYSQYGETGDTANIWNGVTDMLLVSRPIMNRFDFSFKADTTFRLGDSFMLQFMAEYICPTGSKDAVVCIVTKYEGDSILQTVNHVSVPGLSQIRVPANNEKALKEMSGYIYLNEAREGPASESRLLMFISQLQLIRFHSKEIIQANETARTDSLKTDSVQRSDHSGGEKPDTLRRRVLGRRAGGTPPPATLRDPKNRMADGPNLIKE